MFFFTFVPTKLLSLLNKLYCAYVQNLLRNYQIVNIIEKIERQFKLKSIFVDGVESNSYIIDMSTIRV